MADRYYEVLPHEDVDLPELDLLGGIKVAGGPQDDEQGLPVALQLWPLVRLQGVLNGQLVEFELFGYGGELLLGRPVETDPSHPALFAQGLVGLPQRARLSRPMAVHVYGVVHYHQPYTSLHPLYEQDGPLRVRSWPPIRRLGEVCWIRNARRWRSAVGPVHRKPAASGLLLLCSVPSLVTNHSPPSGTGKLIE